ncbi:ankyrin repeat domain-containing protein 26 isoform X16 [Monodelphis domestica]|uniref:ankyrin repeat domain-containing protein 26 isoform X16 n=1 Tax=Monodelphis domestica TaxID=13616 RepID=UPI0024E242E6|nr:ankyrin repeat domain-containing protein 26 isoform X16 [Monodelphis domestica]
MKRIFGFSNKSHSQSRSSVIPRRDSGIDGAVAAKGYRLQDKELGKLHKAASIGDIAKVQRLLRKNDPNEPDKLNRTPLHIACASGYPDVVSLLVERNCKLNLCDGDNRTPLIKAVQCQQEECATILLSHGADPNVVDTRSNTALHYSALGHNRAIAAKLVEHKGDIEAKNQEGYTPLLLAITEHNKEMVDFFLKNGANVNACDNSKRTALMIAVSTEPTSIVNLLLQFDIDLSLQDNYGWTAEEYALVSGFPVHRELILQYGQRQLNQLTSAKISSPDRASDTVFTLGGPALDKEDIKEEKKAQGLGGPGNRKAEIQESPVQTSRTRISGKVVEESSPEDSISRFSDKPGPDDSWPTSDEEELDFSTQKLPKPNLKKLINASQQIRTNGANDEKISRNASPQQSYQKKTHGTLNIEDHKALMSPDNSYVNYQEEDGIGSSQDEGQLADYEDEVAEEEKSEEEEEKFSQDGQDDIDGEEELEYVDTEDEEESQAEDFENMKEKESLNNQQNLSLHTTKYDRNEAKCKISKEKQRTNIPTEFPGSVIADIYEDLSENFYGTFLKEELIDTEEEEKKDGALFDNENREQIHHETSNILSELQAPITSQKCTVRRDMLSALGLEDEEDTESPWDSECTSESLPKESVIHVSAAPNQAMKESISRGSLEDYPKKHPNLQPTQPTLVMKDSFTNQETEKGVMEKEKSDLLEEFGLDDADDIDDVSNWDSPSTSQKNVTYRNYKDLNFDGNYPCKSMPLTKNQSGSTEFGELPLKEDETAAAVQETGPEPRFSVVILVDKPGSQKQSEPQLLLEKEESKKDLTQESEFEGSSEESQENFDKSDQEEVEEEKKKHLHNEMETLEERSDEKLNINKMIGKDNLANKVSDMKDIQHGKDEENKIPGEEIPKMNISNSKESSTPMHHLLECNDSAMNLKYVKKPPSDKWISEDPGITSSCEKVNSLTSILLQVHDDSSLSEDLHEGRPGNETLNKTNKDKGLMDADDLDDLTQSSDTATLDDDLPPSSYKTIILLIEQLSIDCKDSISLLKIQDAVLTYERSLELKKGRCTLLAEKVKSLENKITGLQEELSETREVKSQLEHQKVEWDRELCSLRFTLKQEEEKRLNSEMLFKKISEQLRRKEKQYIKEVEIKEQLELTLRSLHLELKAVRNNLKQVEEERNETQRKLSHEQSARALQDGILSNHFWKQKEAFEANVSKMNQSCEVPDSHEKDLQKNHTLQDEIAMLKLELDAVKIKNQEKENRYTEENEVLKEKNDELQKELKLNEEALTKTVLQYSGQLNVLTTENAMLNSKLKNEKQNRDRVEIEIESYRSRLTSAILDHERSQTSKLDLEHTFQRERDEWLRLQDKLNYDLSSLKDNNGVLSQQLSKAESKANSLENELHLVRDSLREKTLILESTQRDLNQAQYQAKELEHTNQIEKEKLNKYVVKQESMQERFAQIQSENMLLRQQLEDAQNKGIIKEKVVSDVQVQFSDLFNKLRADSEKQVLMVEERNKELINECNHLKEQMCKYENEKAEREVTVRQLQQELADSLKKQSMSEASLEVTSRYRNDLEDKKQQLQKEIDQIKSKLQESEERHLQSKRSTNELEDHIQKLEIENARLEATVKQQMNKIEQIQQNMLDATSLDNEREKLKKLIELKQSLESRLDQEIKRNGELQKDISGFKRLLKATKKKLKDYEKGNLDYQGRMKHACSEEDGQINRLKNKIDELTQQLEDASSKCIHLESMNRGLQEELFSLKTVQKKCDRLEKNKKQLEEEIANLKHHLEIYTLERSQVEQYKREIEERARQEIVEKLKEVNLFLQTQAASQENLEQLRENNNASIRNQMEHRIRDLESELSKLKNSQQDSTKAELEIYRQLYSEELKTRKSLSNKLERTNERLAEVSAELLNEKQRSKTLITSFTASPVLEPPHIGNLNNSLVLNRGLIPRGNIVYSTGNTVSSRNRAEAYFTKMQQELEKNIARELNEATGELESGSCWPSPIGSTDESSRMSNVNQDPVSRATQEYIEVLKKNYML